MKNNRYHSNETLRHRKNIRNRRRHFYLSKKAFMFLATIAIVFSVFMATGIVAKAQEDKQPLYKYYQSYMVEKDDTLLSIAYDINADSCTDKQIKECVEEMIAINSLDHKGTICYGNYIIVPYYSTEYR